MAGSGVLRSVLGWLGILGTLLSPLAYSQNSITQIVVGSRHTCTLLSDGSVTCWGSSLLAADAPALFDRKDFVPVPLSESATAIASGFEHTCTILNSGKVECWGESRNGRLGRIVTAPTDNTYASVPSKPLLVPLPDSLKAVVVVTAQSASAALVANSPSSGKPPFSVWQWGTLTDEDVTKVVAPQELSFGDRYPTKLVGGKSHFCVLLDSSAVSCWGNNKYGQLATGDNQFRPTPVEGTPYSILDLGSEAGKPTTLTSGYSHTCATFSDGRHKCWGGNYEGQLLQSSSQGIGVEPKQLGNNLAYLTAAENGVPIREIQASGEHTCVIYINGVARCWGKDYDVPQPSSEDEGAGFDAERDARLQSVGPSVEPNVSGRLIPLGPLSQVDHIVAGEEHACALLKDGHATCWGNNHGMQLGFDLEPYDVYLLGVRSKAFPDWIRILGVGQ